MRTVMLLLLVGCVVSEGKKDPFPTLESDTDTDADSDADTDTDSDVHTDLQHTDTGLLTDTADTGWTTDTAATGTSDTATPLLANGEACSDPTECMSNECGANQLGSNVCSECDDNKDCSPPSKCVFDTGLGYRVCD